MMVLSSLAVIMIVLAILTLIIGGYSLYRANLLTRRAFFEDYSSRNELKEFLNSSRYHFDRATVSFVLAFLILILASRNFTTRMIITVMSVFPFSILIITGIGMKKLQNDYMDKFKERW